MTPHSGTIVEELQPAPEPWDAFQRLAALPHCLFLDSARRQAELGNCSFLAADPFEFLVCPVGQADALEQLQRRWQRWRTPTLPDLPPFQGGVAGGRGQ